MLRKLLLATALLTASGASFAHGGDYGYGRVVSVEPHFVISFGTRQPDGFRVLYESGGARYWTTHLVLPRPHHRAAAALPGRACLLPRLPTRLG